MWAFGTSQDGLALAPSYFWSLTMREYDALRRVWLDGRRGWAVQAAMYANVHFRKPDEPSFEADHFLGLKARQSGMTPAQMRATVQAWKGSEAVPDWAIEAHKAHLKRMEQVN